MSQTPQIPTPTLTPMEEAQARALDFVASATLYDLVQELIARAADLDKEREANNWREDMNDRKRMIRIIQESRDINNTLHTIALLNELTNGVSA